MALVAVALVCLGVFFLGLTEANEDPELAARVRMNPTGIMPRAGSPSSSPLSTACLTLGTFADSRVLEVLDEDLQTLPELTFLAAGIASAVYTLGIKKQKLIFRQEAPKYTGAIFETIGQFFYIYALADTQHVAFAAPIISSYCVASVIWSRIFLKEKLCSTLSVDSARRRGYSDTWNTRHLNKEKSYELCL